MGPATATTTTCDRFRNSLKAGESALEMTFGEATMNLRTGMNGKARWRREVTIGEGMEGGKRRGCKERRRGGAVGMLKEPGALFKGSMERMGRDTDLTSKHPLLQPFHASHLIIHPTLFNFPQWISWKVCLCRRLE
jgi:hypothetical protein